MQEHHSHFENKTNLCKLQEEINNSFIVCIVLHFLPEDDRFKMTDFKKEKFTDRGWQKTFSVLWFLGLLRTGAPVDPD